MGEIFQTFHSTVIPNPVGHKINFKHEESMFFVQQLFQFLLFSCCRKTDQMEFPEKQAPTKIKYLFPVYQILWNFTLKECEKIIGQQFCFLLSCRCHNTLFNSDFFPLSFLRPLITALVLNMHAVAKLYAATLTTSLTIIPFPYVHYKASSSKKMHENLITCFCLENQVVDM